MSVAATSPSVSRTRAPIEGTYDRAFYGTMAIVLALTAFAGFAPTYYARFLSGGPQATVSGRPFTTAVHLHGALFTAWVLLFIVQTTLVATRRVALHRRLGMIGAGLAAAMIVAGFVTAVEAAGQGASPVGVDPLAFFAVPFFDLVVFGTLVTAAIVWRRTRETHKRLMLLAYVSIITAAIARLPFLAGQSPLVFFGLSFLFVLVAIAYDVISRRRVHAAYLWGGTLFFVSVPLRLAVSGTQVWHSFVSFLIK